ncbi:MAG TPA: hypothetical protein VGM53_19665 [Streptosporangiaceae bacterium]|jgi:hypothetical protein
MVHDMTNYRRRPADVLAAVQAGLADLGVTRLYTASSPGRAVLSVSAGVTAWCDGQTVTWQQDGKPVTWTAADPLGAAQQLAEVAQGS